MPGFGMELPFERFSRDIERQLAQFRALAQPPWTRMLTELSSAHLSTFPHLDSIRQLETQFHHLDLLTRSVIPDITSTVAAVAADLRHLRPMDEITAVLQHLNVASTPELSRLATDLAGTSRISADLALPMLRSVHDAISAILPSPERFRLQFQTSFADQLLRELRDIEAHADDEELPDHVSHLLETFLQKCRSLVRDPTHAWGMFTILVTVLLFLLARYDQQAMEERMVSRVDQAEERTAHLIAEAVQQMVAAVEQLRPATPSVQYVVVREVKLRTRPSGKSHAIRLLYANEIVSLLDTKGTWIQVRVFDYINGSSQTGWVLKKYLKRLEQHPQPFEVGP